MLNAEKAKVGDEVILKTKSVIRQNGQVVIQKRIKIDRPRDGRPAKGERGCGFEDQRSGRYVETW